MAWFEWESPYSIRSAFVIFEKTSTPNTELQSRLEKKDTWVNSEICRDNSGRVCSSKRTKQRGKTTYIFKSKRPPEGRCAMSQENHTGSSFFIDVAHSSTSNSIGWLLWVTFRPPIILLLKSTVYNWLYWTIGRGSLIRQTYEKIIRKQKIRWQYSHNQKKLGVQSKMLQTKRRFVIKSLLKNFIWKIHHFIQ